MRPRKKPNLNPRLAVCESIIIHEPVSLKGHIREQFSNPDAPLHLEIGCGKGQFVCALAARYPEVNFVAMEREENVAVIAIERAVKAGVSNVRFIIDDAEHLPEMFSPAEISQIYINFCDPWHKRRQYKRRLTYRGRLETYKTLLADDGELWFKSDNEPLYRFSCFEFSAAMPPYFSTEDLHESEVASENIMTEYEAHFSGLGQPIFSIRAKK
ncbi:tRNA (guanosine(46)-N7)-methyltransferase TrmB [Oscillospiraceae bacterium PP1C4]